MMKATLTVLVTVFVSIVVLFPGCDTNTPSESGPATKLGFQSVPSQLTAGVVFTMTVPALKSDNTIDQNYNGSVTIAKATGPGTLSGTLIKSAVAGVATFSDLVVDSVGDYTFSVTSGNLASAVSSIVTAQPATSSPMVIKTGTFSSQNGYTTAGIVEVVRNSDNSESLRTGSNFSVSGGAGSIGVWLTNSAGATNLNSTSQKIRVGLINSGFSGVYEYPIAGGLGTYTHVVTFCEAAQINFGNAELRDP